jgi:N utilization substance protein B
MLFASDVVQDNAAALTTNYWNELGDTAIDDKTRDFANGLVRGTIERISEIDDRIRTRAEHWRIERMAIVDRNVLRLAVYEFLYHDTPNNVAINEALEIARRFSTYEATQFINGILDGIKQDLESKNEPAEKSQASSN